MARNIMSGLVLGPQQNLEPSRGVVIAADAATHSDADEALLEDRVPPAYRLSAAHAGAVLTLGLVFLFYSSRPLWHTDLWGHLSYGRYLTTHGALPATEPLMPLAKGVPFVDPAWLSQVVGYSAFSALNLPGLRGLAAGLTTLVATLLLSYAWKRTGQLRFAVLGLFAALWLLSTELMVIRPQLAGLACFVITFGFVLARRPGWKTWCAVPVLFALWANLHGSFIMGLVLIGLFAAGRAFDLLRHSGQLRSLAHDSKFVRLALWLQLAAVAACLNPYGWSIYNAVFSLSANPNLQALTEWQPLGIRTLGGQVFLGVAILLAVLYRFTPRRIASAEVLTLVALGVGALWTSRLMVWWAPVAGYYLAVHAAAVWRVTRRSHLIPSASTSGKWTLVTVGLVWISFGFSPLGLYLLHGKMVPESQSLSSNTPIGAVQYLKDHPPVGQVYHIFEWGDYLQWAGPPGTQVFLNSHAHAVPTEVWQHYLHILDQGANRDELLDRYSVNTILLDTEYRTQFIKKLKEEAKWRLAFEDNRAAVFVRRKPLGADAIRAVTDRAHAPETKASTKVEDAVETPPTDTAH